MQIDTRATKPQVSNSKKLKSESEKPQKLESDSKFKKQRLELEQDEPIPH